MELNENVKKWVEALRSGEYEQAKGALERQGKYCCLGVACMVALENGVPLLVERIKSQLDVGWEETAFDESTQYLPERVIEWLGLNNNGQPLAGMNDTGFTFEQIADKIESGELKDLTWEGP